MEMKDYFDADRMNCFIPMNTQSLRRGTRGNAATECAALVSFVSSLIFHRRRLIGCYSPLWWLFLVWAHSAINSAALHSSFLPFSPHLQTQFNIFPIDGSDLFGLGKISQRSAESIAEAEILLQNLIPKWRIASYFMCRNKINKMSSLGLSAGRLPPFLLSMVL